ncbi:MAG: hypothetical protein IPI73_23445 [Betaproteobacteria bacterium]|nr:hypothetical protein [Betaproteobacteria bacterium]
MWLLKLDDILLATQTNSTCPAAPGSRTPLGLFVLSDALIAAVHRWCVCGPWLRLELASALLVLLPAVLPLERRRSSSPVPAALHAGDGRQGKERGDEIVMAFTSLDVNRPTSARAPKPGPLSNTRACPSTAMTWPFCSHATGRPRLSETSKGRHDAVPVRRRHAAAVDARLRGR